MYKILMIKSISQASKRLPDPANLKRILTCWEEMMFTIDKENFLWVKIIKNIVNNYAGATFY